MQTPRRSWPTIQASIQQHRDDERRQRDAENAAGDAHDVPITADDDADPTIRLGVTPPPDETTIELRTLDAPKPGAVPPLVLQLPAAPRAPVVDLALPTEAIGAWTPTAEPSDWVKTVDPSRRLKYADPSHWIKYAGIGAAVLALRPWWCGWSRVPRRHRSLRPLFPGPWSSTLRRGRTSRRSPARRTGKPCRSTAVRRPVSFRCRPASIMFAPAIRTFLERSSSTSRSNQAESGKSVDRCPGSAPEDEVSKILDGKN